MHAISSIAIRQTTILTCWCCCIGWLLASASAETVTVDFAGLLDAPESHWNGPAEQGETVEGEYGPEVVGTFASHGLQFTNIYEQTYGSWRGFSYSNETDTTTAGFTNQFSACAGSGHGTTDDTYAVGFGHWDLDETFDSDEPFDPSNQAHLFALPTLELPYGSTIESTWITNTTYAALSMRDGDSFAKAFGGEFGTDPDWLRITAYGTDASGTPLDGSVDFYLADFRSTDAGEDYIVADWTEWDLSALEGARRVHFNLASSDVGLFGMNTPATFALDDITLRFDLPAGDYNRDGLVNLADYTLWRDSLGSTVDWVGSGADGNLDGVVDFDDYELWKLQFAAASAAGNIALGHAVPEPSAAAVCFYLLGLTFVVRALFTH
ncbi:DUF4465 domain-containing protein [Aeoliella mucimassa]|uniref:DUF4465 domain-containing protein n=1 Tax=Aeoliella mucimassa TaxID=2527972 RepID=A0A518AI92_9BACT|nr:DUF4465 domain-containing protein [Aeoliella mucimassa]QDU54451.1 hypothetical protein Pan181_06330 [Aeoliella mucimassa]